MEGTAQRVADTPEVERVHVQDVYDRIADHFSRTRYAVCSFPAPFFFVMTLLLCFSLPLTHECDRHGRAQRRS